MEIRKATMQDFEEVLKIKLESKQEERSINKELKPVEEVKEYYKGYLRNDLSRDWRAIFIAIENNKVIGLITGKIYRTLKIAGYERCGYISNLYVKEEFRKKGIAEKLVEEATAWFKRKGAVKISLEIYEINDKAVNLYHKLGFKNYSVKMKKSFSQK